MEFDAIMWKLLNDAAFFCVHGNHWRMDQYTRMELHRRATLSYSPEPETYYGLPIVAEHRLPLWSKSPANTDSVNDPRAEIKPDRFITLAAKQRGPDGRWLYLDHKL